MSSRVSLVGACLVALALTIPQTAVLAQDGEPKPDAPGDVTDEAFEARVRQLIEIYRESSGDSVSEEELRALAIQQIRAQEKAAADAEAESAEAMDSAFEGPAETPEEYEARVQARMDAVRAQIGPGLSDEMLRMVVEEQLAKEGPVGERTVEEYPGPYYIPGVDWVEGPTEVDLGSEGVMQLPAGWWFADGPDTETAMRAMENFPSGTERGMVTPPGGEWFVVFNFEAVGYVPDDEKDSIDADELLDSIREGTEAANEVRRRRGWEELKILGWAREPYFDDTTKNLQWAVEAFSDSGTVVNHNIRLLGRRGVMEVQWVGEGIQRKEAMPQVHSLLEDFEFKAGERYAEYQDGDRVAEYGLAALITGGAVAAGAKSGFFKHLWKLILVGIGAVVAFFKKLFGGGGGGDGGRSERRRRRRGGGGDGRTPIITEG